MQYLLNPTRYNKKHIKNQLSKLEKVVLKITFRDGKTKREKVILATRARCAYRTILCLQQD